MGDRGYATGATPGSGYTIDVVLDPTIEPVAWQAAFRQAGTIMGWDQLDTPVGPIVMTGQDRFLYAGPGIAVEVTGFSPEREAVAEFVKLLPSAGAPAPFPPEATERGRLLASWAPPKPLSWIGNRFRMGGAWVAPRPLADLAPGSALTDLADSLCVDPAQVPAFAVNRYDPVSGPPTLYVAELLDPSGDATRWIGPLQRSIAKSPSTTKKEGPGYRKLGKALLGNRHGVVFRRLDDDGLVVVASGPAVTLFAGSDDEVRAALASYPFAEAPRPNEPGAKPSGMSCGKADR